jgi:diadenosine tetraphosphatase ApaH/serine/threonine PP2A family protein phosphatase
LGEIDEMRFRWDLLIGATGLVLGAVALKPILFPPPPDCSPIRAQLISATSDGESSKKQARQLTDEFERLETAIAASEERKTTVEGFLQEQDIADDMISYAEALRLGASEYDDKYESYKPIRDNMWGTSSAPPSALIDEFRSLLANASAIPSNGGQRRDQRLVFMDFGYTPFDYRVFDSLPRYPDEARKIADRLESAAQNPGPFSRKLWNDGSWSNSYRQFGAQAEISHLVENIESASKRRAQVRQDFDQLIGETDAQTGTVAALKSLLIELGCSE